MELKVRDFTQIQRRCKEYNKDAGISIDLTADANYIDRNVANLFEREMLNSIFLVVQHDSFVISLIPNIKEDDLFHH